MLYLAGVGRAVPDACSVHVVSFRYPAPRNQLETHGLLGSEEAVDFRAAGHADDALTEFREAGLARDVPPPESRPTSVGRSGAPLGAVAVARCSRGCVAGAE